MAKPRGDDIRLGKLELEIMQVVWRLEQATVQEVKDALASRRERAYSTILTMMRNLEDKGYLRHEVDGRTYVYRPAIERGKVRRGLLGDLIERLFNGSPSLLVNSLVDDGFVNEEELVEIRRLVEKRSQPK